MATVKVYEIGDDEWIAARSQEEAIAYFQKETGLNVEAEEMPVVEMPPAAMDKYTFREDDGARRSFTAQLERMVESGETFPTYFASGNC